MKGMIKYEIWATIEIKHEYYVNDNIPLILLPDIETRLLFAKYNMIFRKQLTNQWILLKPLKEEVLPDKTEFVFRFELQVTSEDFYYSTNDFKNELSDSFALKNSTKPNLWKILEVPYRADRVENEAHIFLQLSSKRKYFEYILIPKYTLTKNINLKLSEEKGKIDFEGPEKMTLFNETEVLRFISKESVSLKSINAYKIRLWEIRPAGERLLSEYIPCPKADDISVIQPENAISTYYYF